MCSISVSQIDQLESEEGSSASSMMREEIKLYLIENTLATHLEDETSQTNIRA